MGTSGKLTGCVILALLVLAAAYLICLIFANPEVYQWDFKMYYHAARVQASGGNPYDPEALHRLAGGRLLLRYAYPPPTLVLFQPLTYVSYPVAHYLWLALKLCFLGGLLVMWRRFIFPAEPLIPSTVFILLAFSATIYVDLVSGNISLIEQSLLWLGFVFLLRAKPLGFCIAVLLAASFKVMPLAFLFLLPLVGVRHAWRYVLASVAAFAGLCALTYAGDPVGYGRFVASASAIDERGASGNISLLAFSKDAFDLLLGPQSAAGPVPYIIYGMAAVAVILVSLRAMRTARRTMPDDHGPLILFLFAVAFALTMPRFKLYSYILLLPPAYWVIRRGAKLSTFAFLLALFLLDVQRPFPVKLPTAPVLTLFWSYYPLLLTSLVWGLLLRHCRSSPSPAPAGMTT